MVLLYVHIFSYVWKTSQLTHSQDRTFTIKVEDDKPIWLYCSQNAPRPHCGAGMVAVINPPTSGANTLDAYKSTAATKGDAVSPAGGPRGGEVSTPGSGSPTSSSPSGTPSEKPTGAAGSLGTSAALGFVALLVVLGL